MSEATELLNSLDEANTSLRLANPTEEPHIIIDEDRYITVPEELERLGVQYDHNIETVTFDCPRYWDGHDMSKMKVYINYLCADNAPGVYQAENIRLDTPDSSIMHFDWTISKNVTAAAGNIVFIVCVKKADDEGNEQNHWNSELCRDCRISEGLEIDGGVSENIRPDVIEQWYHELMAMANSGDFDGAPGVGIASVEQTTTSLSDGGKNIVTITLTDGQIEKVVIRNGMTGTAELPTALCKTTDGIHYYCLSTSIDGGWPLVSGNQIIFIQVPEADGEETNVTSNPTLSFELASMLSGDFPIKLRTVGGGPADIPIGALRANVPYTMTFTGEYWLIDSYMGISEGGTVEGVTQSQMENYVSTAIADINQAVIVNAESEDGVIYTSVDSYEENWLEEGKQIVFVPEVISDSGELKLHLSGMDKSYPISLRPVEDHSTVIIPVGLFQPKVPYIMTFSLDTWWVDSYIDMPNNNAQLPVITVESMDGETFTYSSSHIEGLFEKGRQIIVILDDGSQSNTTETPELSFEFNDGYESQTNDIVIRSELYIYNNVPIGALKPGIPYTMTFDGQHWLIDSMIRNTPSNSWTKEQIDLLDTLLSMVVFTSDQAGEVAAQLITSLRKSAESDTASVTQLGSALKISGGVTAVQSGTNLSII